jgi:hypothetical protein
MPWLWAVKVEGRETELGDRDAEDAKDETDDAGKDVEGNSEQRQ